MKILRAIAAVTLALVSTVFAIGVVVWTGNASPPSEVALQALNSDSAVFVSAENGWLVFHPADDLRPETGFIFYPGANVDFRAYAPVMKLIAAEGYFVTVLPMPLNLSFFDPNGAARAQAAYPEIENWFVGGHSLGGVTASSYVAIHPDIKGAILWASTPADDALIARGANVLSIYATRDGLFTLADLDESRGLLPANTIFVPIEGGNHSQFGSYGLQDGDLEAAISPEEQWAQVAAATVEFMEGVLK